MTKPTTTRRACDRGQAGFGLIEVMAAVVVTAVGVLAATSGALAIYSESNRSREDTDRTLAARTALERSALGPFASVLGRQATTSFGSRGYVVTETVGSLGSRLKSLRVTVASPNGQAPVTFETRVVASRPLPSAP